MPKPNSPSSLSRFKNFYKDNPWKGRTLLAISTLCLLLVIVRLILTPTIIYGVNNWLKEQGIDSSIEDINIGLFNGTVSLLNATGSRDNKTVFDIGLIDIHWRWTPLSNKTIEVTGLVFDKINFNIEKYNDAIIVGGIQIPLETNSTSSDNKNETIESEKNQQHWSAALGSVSLKNINVCFLQHETSLDIASDNSRLLDYCVGLQEMVWSGTISYGLESSLVKNDGLPLSSTGNFALNGLIVRDNKLNKTLLASKSNTLNDVKISGLNNIHIAEIDMSELSALERDDKQHIDTVRFKSLSIHDINFTSLNSLSLGTIQLNEPGLYLVKNNQKSWEHQPWIPKSNISSEATSEQKIASSNSEFKLTINNISINAPDLCYLKTNTSQYYCFTAQALKWDGAIKYNNSLVAKGNASILQPKIRNHSINRNLITIKALALGQLSISNFNDVSLNNFSIEKLNALQRGKNKDDATASFNKLIISDIHYSKDKLSIDTIDLDGVTSNLSINKDGSWEHSKWSVAGDKDSIKNAKKKDEKKPDETKPLRLALNKLTISTNNKNLFTDNSTKPATVAGLDKLTFDLSKLNADKPDTDSPFKLFAKTTRHSTIDLEGTFRPFAEKISINADGKLKGFDLRAASPTAHKAIGHIIKSGQLDADITLLATDGILDSNIALSLYHFNLKALSKKDADKLDDLFGMPINQSLVLLRDKDDSIHLDIPITGNINNPNFNPMDAIIKATTKATTVTLITFYTPYGLVYAGGNILFNIATALNFDPIKFEAGSSKLSDDNKNDVDSLTKLLTEKPHVHLTLCGITNLKDYDILFPDSKKSSKNEVVLSEDQMIELNKLATERQIKIKNYLVKEKGIEHERLILCTPEFKSNTDAISGVEINI